MRRVDFELCLNRLSAPLTRDHYARGKCVRSTEPVSDSRLPAKVSFSCPAVPAAPVLPLDSSRWATAPALGVTRARHVPAWLPHPCRGAAPPGAVGSTGGKELAAGRSRAHSAPAPHTAPEPRPWAVLGCRLFGRAWPPPRPAGRARSGR